MTLQQTIARGTLLASFLAGCAGAQSLAKINPASNPTLLAEATAPANFPVPALFSSSTANAAASEDLTLPDAPSATLGQQEDKKDKQPPKAIRVPRAVADSGAAGREAPPYTKYIPAGFVTHPQSFKEKELTGFQDLYSIGNIGSMFLSAGWEHLNNSQPNYGTDRGAFGQRLGAAAIRETSQGIFTDMVFSPILHQDLRYYVRGPQHNPINRSLYAISRVFLARQDSGHSTFNSALFLGYAATTGLEQTYYPQQNRNFNDAASSFGGSIGGAALGNIFSEFQYDLLTAIHLKKKWQP